MGIEAGIGAMFSIIGGSQQASAARRGGEAESLAARHEADNAEMDALRLEKETVEKVRRFGIQVQKAEGSNRAAISSSGITTEGSAMDVLVENSRNAALDKLNIEYQGSTRAKDLRRDAKFMREKGTRLQDAGSTAASAALLSGVGNAMSFLTPTGKGG